MSRCVNMSENVTWILREFSPHVTFCHFFATYNVTGYSYKEIAYNTCMLFFQVTLITMLRYEDRQAWIKDESMVKYSIFK